MKVASGTVLPLVAIGDLALSELSGFILEPDGSRTQTTTSGTWHNMLVVEGLDPDTILVSVRQMRDQDGILTHFNNDSEAGVNDCLKFPSGVYVPFSSDRFELTGIISTRGETHQCNNLTGTKRSSLHIHTALCHAGTQRTKSSNVYIDGQKVDLFRQRSCAKVVP